MKKRGAKSSVKNSVALVVRGTVRRAGGDPLVEEAVVEIRRIWRSGVRDTVVELGEYLIKTFYGSVKAARSQTAIKEASLQSLLARVDELPVSAHALKMSVGVALMVRELPRPISSALTVSHLEKLLPVRDPEVGLRLASVAAHQKLSVAELEERVRAVQPPHPGGRSVQQPLVRGVSAVVRALSSQAIADGLTPSALRTLSREQLDTLDIQVRRARELLEQVGDGIARRLRG